MFDLTTYRIIQGLIIIAFIVPEIAYYIALRNEHPLSKHLIAEHLGKIGYIVVAASVFFYVRNIGTLPIDAGLLFILAENILFIPFIIRRAFGTR